MSIYLNAFLMLVATVAAFVLLSRLVQAVRLKSFGLPWRAGDAVADSRQRLAVKQIWVIDPKRRLMLIQCDEQRLLLLTGGPGDLLVPLAAQAELSAP